MDCINESATLKYIAFLRGINIIGNNIIKMDELTQLFLSAGCQKVQTIIQSGNVIFETAETNWETIAEKIEKDIWRLNGYNISVIIRTMNEIEKIAESSPFENLKPDDEVKHYITFLSGEPIRKAELPLTTPKKDVEVFEIKNLEVFSFGRLINGRYGFPNNFIEKELGVTATTRNWTTIVRLMNKIQYL